MTGGGRVWKENIWKRPLRRLQMLTVTFFLLYFYGIFLTISASLCLMVIIRDDVSFPVTPVMIRYRSFTSLLVIFIMIFPKNEIKIIRLLFHFYVYIRFERRTLNVLKIVT